MLDQLNGDPAEYLYDCAVSSDAEITLQSLQASLVHFLGPIRDHSKWSDSDKHAQLTAVAYDIIAVMVTYDCSNVVIRTRSSLMSADVVRTVISTAMLLGLQFSGCAGAGRRYWGG